MTSWDGSDTVTLEAQGHALRLRVYRPTDASEPAGRPVLVWMHGGAFMFGDLEMPEADWVSRELSARGVVVLSVDYALAPLDAVPALAPPPDADVPPDVPDLATLAVAAGPRARFPVASLQVVAAFDWARQNAAALGGDPDRVCLGGASAGANLAAGTALRLRDRGGPGAAAVLLAYPVLHAPLPEVDDELAAMLDEIPRWLTFPPEVTEAINRNYAPDDLGSPYAFPGGHDLRGLPPTLIVNSEADRLRASGQAYAAELALAGVDVSVVRERGTMHGHLNDADSPAATRTLDRFATWIYGFAAGT